MANRIKGITVEIGGDTTKLSTALKSVNGEIKATQAQLRDVNKLLKLDPGNTELLAQKHKLLGQAIDETKQKLQTLKEAQVQAKQALESGAITQSQYDALGREIAEAEGQLKQFKSQLETVNAYSLDKLGSEVEKVGNKIESAGAKVKGFGQTLTTGVTLPLVGVGTAGFKLAADVEDALGASDQIFRNSSDEVKSWVDNLASYYGIAKGDALSYANTMGAMLQNIGGLSEAEAARQSALLVELAGDLSAMFGGTTESAVLALTGALKGNTSMLDNYGMGVNQATIKQKALEMGLIAEREEMSLAAKQAATLALIMEQTGAAQGQAAREADGASGSLKQLTTDLKNLLAEIGEALIPILVPLIQQVSEFVRLFKGLSPEMKQLIVTVGMIVAAIGPLLVVIGTIIEKTGVIVKTVGALIKYGPALLGVFSKLSGFVTGTLIPGIASLVAAIGWVPLAIGAIVAAVVVLWDKCDWFREGIIALWETVKQATITAWQATRDFLAQTWQYLVQVATTTWTQLCQGVSELVQSVTDFIKTAWTNLSSATQTIFTALAQFVSQLWTRIHTTVTQVAQSIYQAIQAVWQAIFKTVSTVLNQLHQWISNTWSTITSLTVSTWQSIYSGIASVWQALYQTVAQILQSIYDFISSAFQGMWESIATVIGGIYQTIANGLNQAAQAILNVVSQAPTWGWDLMVGLANGIWDAMKHVVDAVSSVAKTIWSYLHFSVPEMGPLTDYESWMPDFMEGLAKGIHRHQHLVKDSVAHLAEGMVLSPSMDLQGLKGGQINPSGIHSTKETGLTASSGQTGDIVIPVYLGGKLLDEVIVNAHQRHLLRSGGM